MATEQSTALYPSPLQIGLFLPSGGIDMMGGKNARWVDLLAMARRAEEVGFDFVGILDHLEDYWEAWSVMSGLAVGTSRIGIVSFVTCTTYRNPALLARMAETLDEISGGRLTLGLGAGDSDTGHRIYGFPRDKPVSRFEEAVQIITTLLRVGRCAFEGQYYSIRDCELRPRGPRPGGPPILIGSLGGSRMRRLTVQHADIWNGATLLTSNSPEGTLPLLAALDATCREHGRDPATLGRMAEVLVEFPGGQSKTWTEMPPISGSPEEIAAALRAFGEAGFDQLMLWIEPNNLEGIERMAEVVKGMKG